MIITMTNDEILTLNSGSEKPYELTPDEKLKVGCVTVHRARHRESEAHGGGHPQQHVDRGVGTADV